MRFRHKVTGVVVSVSDDKAEQLGSAYEPAEQKKATAKKTAAKKADSSNDK